MKANIIEKVIRINQLALILNGKSTNREKTGDKPTVFFNFYGHVCIFDIWIHDKGWSKDEPYNRESEYWSADLENDESEKILDEVIQVLSGMIEEEWN